MKKNKLYYYKKYIVFIFKQAADRLYRFYLRLSLKNREFTIISNNCIAGSIYEDLGIKYNTPTVGLFFYSPCYIKFVTNLKHYLSCELTFKKTSRYVEANELNQKHFYPIGVLDDIEIQFLHYTSEEEAYDKWNRRKNRVNFSNLFFIFTDNEKYTTEEITTFDSLPYPAVFFSSKEIKSIKSLIFLKCRKEMKDVGNLYDNRWIYRRYFNAAKWLNSKI